MKILELPKTTKIILSYFVISIICAIIKSEIIAVHVENSIKSLFRLANFIIIPVTIIFSIFLIIVSNLLIWNIIKIHQVFILFSEWLYTIQTTFKVLIISEIFKLGLVFIFLKDDLQKSIISEDFFKNTFYFKLSVISDIFFYFVVSLIMLIKPKNGLIESFNTRLLISTYLFTTYTLIYIYYLS
jgi:hypothetical protein